MNFEIGATCWTIINEDSLFIEPVKGVLIENLDDELKIKTSDGYHTPFNEIYTYQSESEAWERYKGTLNLSLKLLEVKKLKIKEKIEKADLRIKELKNNEF